ncbi:MAG: hypothetical protein ABFD08_04370 [Syntrophomonas sp.]
MKKKLETLRDLLGRDLDEASRAISYGEKKIAGFMQQADIDNLSELNELFISSVSGMKPADRASYLLGKAHALSEVASFFNQPYEQEKLARSLSDREILILQLIREHDEVTPAMLARRLETSSQNVVNYLGRLKSKSLIKVLHAGKNAWYSLSGMGKKTLEARYQVQTPDLARLIEEEQLLKARICKEEESLRELQAEIDGLSNKSSMEGQVSGLRTGTSELSGAFCTGPEFSSKVRKTPGAAAKKSGAALKGKKAASRSRHLEQMPANDVSRHTVSASRKQKKK